MTVHIRPPDWAMTVIEQTLDYVIDCEVDGGEPQTGEAAYWHELDDPTSWLHGDPDGLFGGPSTHDFAELLFTATAVPDQAVGVNHLERLGLHLLAIQFAVLAQEPR